MEEKNKKDAMHEYSGQRVHWQGKLIEMLVYLDTLFKEHQIPYWLNFGTLLGAARNGKMIPWDIDIDLGMFLSDVDRLLALRSIIAGASFVLTIKKGTEGVPISLVLHEPGKIQYHIDLSPHFIQGNKAIWTAVRHIIDIPEYLHNLYHTLLEVQNLCEIEFEGRKYPCVRNYVNWLEKAYKDWRIPQVQTLAAWYIEKYDPTNEDIKNEMKKYMKYEC